MSEGHSVLVSIIIPVFNRESVITKCIQSIQAQEYEQWEAIIVDDGSSDNTVQTVEAIAIHDHRIQLYKRPGIKKGGNVCRNLGIQKAKGVYLIFLDSDDLLQKNCIKNRVNTALRNQGMDLLVFPGAVFADDPGKPQWHWNIASGQDDLTRFFNFDSPWQTSGPLWKKEFLLQKELLWDEELCMWQDVDFHIRALLSNPAYKVYWDNSYDYLVNNSSADSLSRIDYNNPQKIQARKYFAEKYISLFSSIYQDIDLTLLKPASLAWLTITARQKKWISFFRKAAFFRKKNIFSFSEYRNILINGIAAAISFNKVSRWAFPSAAVKKTGITAISGTLQSVPL